MWPWRSVTARRRTPLDLGFGHGGVAEQQPAPIGGLQRGRGQWFRLDPTLGRARPRRDRRCRSAASRPSAGPRRWSVPALLSLFGTHEGHLCQEGVRVWPGDRVRSRAGYRSGSSSQLPGVTPARGGGSWGRRVLFVLACEGRVSPECGGWSGLTSRTRSRSGPLSGPFLLATLAIGCPARRGGLPPPAPTSRRWVSSAGTGPGDHLQRRQGRHHPTGATDRAGD